VRLSDLDNRLFDIGECRIIRTADLHLREQSLELPDLTADEPIRPEPLHVGFIGDESGRCRRKTFRLA
jgi:hypothetical protein